jgi:hypothetical protein
MKKILLPLSILAVTFAYSQVGIGTSTPNTSSILELQASDKGLLLPRVALTDVTLAAPLATHVQGMVVYNTASTITGYTGDAEGIWRNDGTQWRRGTGSGAGSGTDLIGQTSGIISNPTAITTNAETFLGLEAGSSASLSGQTFIGYQAGLKNVNKSNTFVGYRAGADATSAGGGAFLGYDAGYNATNASSSSFLGYYAGKNATNASRSVFIGRGAGDGATNAANSIFIGSQAGTSDTVDNTAVITPARTSILIGNNTSTGGFSRSVAIGNGAVNTAGGNS